MNIKILEVKEAVKTALALNIIRLLQQYKQVDEAPIPFDSTFFFIHISNNYLGQSEK